MIRYFLIIFSLFLAGSLEAAESNFLCHSNEKIIFACSLGKKQVSVCASPNMTLTTGSVQYRYGTPQKIEMVYPKDKVAPKGYFFLSNTAYSGGGASRLRFENESYEYFIFDRTIRTHFVAGEPNYPKFDAGLFIQKQGKIVSGFHCKDNDASIHSEAYDHFEREEYNDLIQFPK